MTTPRLSYRVGKEMAIAPEASRRHGCPILRTEKATCAVDAGGLLPLPNEAKKDLTPSQKYATIVVVFNIATGLGNGNSV